MIFRKPLPTDHTSTYVPDDTNLLDALKGTGEEGEEVPPSLHDVLGSAPQLDTRLLEDFGVELIDSHLEGADGARP